MALASREYPTRSLIRDLAPYLKPYRVRLFSATVARAIADLAWLYPPYGLALIINFLTDYVPGSSLTPIWNIIGLFFAAVIVRYVGLYAAKMLMFSTGERLSLDLQMATISHLFALDISWHEKENTGNKLKRLTRGANDANRILRIWINNVLEIIVNFVGITIVLANFDRTIALMAVVFLILYYFLALSFRRKSSQAAIVVNLQEEEQQGVQFEALNNIRSVKVLGMAQPLHAVLGRYSQELLGKIRKRIFWFQTGNTMRGLFSQLFQFGALVYVVLAIVDGQYEVGMLILFYSYFGRLVQSVGELANITQEYVIAKLSVGRMFAVLKEPILIDREEGKRPFPVDWKEITLKDVSFTYGETAVLNNVSFTIRRGEKVGVVGLSGAGKSTLFKLLLKEHETYTGEILIDGIPLRSIQRQDYFSYTAVVLQETEVFNFSLRQNVVLANDREAENEKLFDRALRVAHVDDFLKRLPDGVETLIGEKGVRLSGGERQRLGIARAVFKQPQLLLLDEATSHLDVESEENIQASLHEFFRDVTAVVIAHRLTTIKEMDRILVLEGGEVLEEGSFNELHARKGRFYELWEKQNL